MRANCRRYPDADAAERALAALVDSGLARWVDPQTDMKGGKPIKVVELCMTRDTDDTDPGGDDGGGPGTHDNADDTAPAPGTSPGTASPHVRSSTEVSNGEPSGSPGGVIGVMRHAEETGLDGDGGTGQDRCHAGDEGADPAVKHSPGSPEVGSTASLPYLLVRDRAGLEMVATALDGTALVGLDLETTGLDPRTDRVRLLSLACDTVDGGTMAYLVDCFAVDPAPLWEVLAGKDLILHNAAFDLGFLARQGFVPEGRVRDTMLLAHLLTAGLLPRVTIALVACCERWLDRPLDKAEQRSDWSGRLSEDQLAYAARDVEVLGPLLEALSAEIAGAKLQDAAEIEERCLPAIVWMAGHGVAIDRDAWTALARAAIEEADRLQTELDAIVPHGPDEMFESRNWGSAPQVREALAQVGCVVENTSDATLATLDHPLAGLLRRYRDASKQASAFGIRWLDHVAADGRIYPSWRQVGTVAGRMSCRDPNMQQLPRGVHRRCVTAPPGRVLVKADYSQIELRIAAKVSGDKALLDAHLRGEDLHTRTARSVLGIDEVTKQDRQLAKAINFGLLYGMGVRGFRQYACNQYGVDLTEEEAARYRAAFFQAYPGLAAWHRRVRSRKATETRTRSGRRRLMDDRTPDTHRLNSPIQGTGADGLKLALALLWERRDRVPGAFPVLAVHDEIVVEADADRADAVAAWLKGAMVRAMAPLIEPVPVEVDVTVAPTWGGS